MLLFFDYLVTVVGLERVDGLSRDAAVEAAWVGRELSAVGQSRAAVRVIHPHSARRALGDLVYFAVVLIKNKIIIIIFFFSRK